MRRKSPGTKQGMQRPTRQSSVILVKIIVYMLMFLGLTVGLGIAYGGMRIAIKRLFPGKVFDRPEDIEVLQMGLSGKKIDSSDMY